jgi:uncharacterized peroxidase-related enzyme
LKPELATAIANGHWREASGLTNREIALCTIAEKLSTTPARMMEEDWRPLRDLGFDDRACLEVAHIVGLFNYLVRLADGFGLRPTDAAHSTSA